MKKETKIIPDLYKHIYLEKTGTLKDFLSEYELENITHLKISGIIGTKDFEGLLEKMCWSERIYEKEDYDELDDWITLDKNEPCFL